MSGVELMMAAISGVQAVAGGMQQAKSQKRSAAAATQQANYQRQLTDAEVAKKRRATALQMGTQRARLGGKGVDLTRGSALTAQEDLAAESELDALMTKSQGYNRAFSSDIAASNAQLNAKNTMVNTGLGAASNLLTTWGKI